MNSEILAISFGWSFIDANVTATR